MKMSSDEIIEILSHTADLNDLRSFCNVNNKIKQICHAHKITIMKKFWNNKGVRINFDQFTHNTIDKILKLFNQMYAYFGYKNPYAFQPIKMTCAEFIRKYNLSSPYATSLFYEMTFLSESLKQEWFLWVKKIHDITIFNKEIGNMFKGKNKKNIYDIWNTFVIYYELQFDEMYNELKFNLIENELASIVTHSMYNEWEDYKVDNNFHSFYSYPLAEQIALWHGFIL